MLGLRATARAVGIDHAHLKRLSDSGQVPRNLDGSFDAEAVRKALASNIDQGQSRKPPGRKTGDSSPPGHQSPRHQSPHVVTTLPNALTLWSLLRQVPAQVAWERAGPDCGLQACFDAYQVTKLNITGEARLTGGIDLPDDFETVDWRGLADEFGLAFIQPRAMAADWQRRLDEP